MGTNTNLDAIRARFGAFFTVFLWCNVALVAAAVLFNEGVANAGPLALAVLLAAVPTWLQARRGTTTVGAICGAVGLAGLIALLVYGFRWSGEGMALQIDVHMYFFACLAIVAGFVDWRPLLAFTVVVAVHHLGMTFLLPSAVFPDGASTTRVALHAAILLAQLGILVWLTSQIEAVFAKAQSAVEEARDAERAASGLRRTADENAAMQSERHRELSARMTAFHGQMHTLLAALGGSMNKLLEVSGVLDASADETHGAVESLSAAADGASQNVGTVASAAEQLAASIQQISRQVAGSSELAQVASDRATRSNDKVAALARSAERIGHVVGLINDIAEQTNLLALNATIEAARAGDAGRGFAVVASEVKQLASETAKATEEISAQVEMIQTSTRDAAASIGEITSTIAEVNDHTTAMAAAIAEQGGATRDISRSVSQAADAAATVSSTVRDVTGASRRTEQAAGDVRQSADDVADVVRRLRAEVDNFIEVLRAA